MKNVRLTSDVSMAALNNDGQNHVLRRVYRRLWEIEPKLFQWGEPWRPAGACAICDHIEHLMESALLAHNDAQAKERVCSNCYHRTPYGYCPFRTNCVFNRYHQLIMDAVAEAVLELRSDVRNENGHHEVGHPKAERR